MKESIVTKVEQKKDKNGGFHGFETANGVFWTWQVAFENKDWGEFNVKDTYQPKFKVGEMGHYTIKPNERNPEWPMKVTHENPNFKPFSAPVNIGTLKPGEEVQVVAGVEDGKISQKDRLIIREVCIKASAHFWAARASSQSWESTADEMFTWVIKPERIETAEIVHDALTQEFKQKVEEEEDNLPF